jgi:hypothetical protein
VDTISIRETTTEVPLESAATCAGCSRRLPKQELITVHEGRHDNLRFFNGDLICRPCARANGVEF